MVERSRGKYSRKSRMLRKHPRMRGKVSITRLLQEFEPGTKVIVDIEPSFHKGMPHPRFQGKCGIVKEKRGRAYVVSIKDGNAWKEITVHPVHLRVVE